MKLHLPIVLLTTVLCTAAYGALPNASENNAAKNSVEGGDSKLVIKGYDENVSGNYAENNDTEGYNSFDIQNSDVTLGDLDGISKISMGGSSVRIGSLNSVNGDAIELTIQTGSLSVEDDLVLAQNSRVYGSPFKPNGAVVAKSISSVGKVYVEGGDMTATEGDIELRDSTVVKYNTPFNGNNSTLTSDKGNVNLINTTLTDVELSAKNGVIALNNITSTGALALTASTSAWSTIDGNNTMKDVVLNAGQLQIKKAATLEADNIELNGRTFFDGKTTTQKLTVNNSSVNARVNELNVTDTLQLNSSALTVSNDATVKAGQLIVDKSSSTVSVSNGELSVDKLTTRSTGSFGPAFSVGDAGHLIIGTEDADTVHELSDGTRLAASGSGKVSAYGTLQGDRITVTGNADIESIKGDGFIYRQNAVNSEVSFKLGSLDGNSADISNDSGSVQVDSITADDQYLSSSIKAKDDVTVGLVESAGYTALTSNEGGVRITDGGTAKGLRVTAKTDAAVSEMSVTDANIQAEGKVSIDDSTITTAAISAGSDVLLRNSEVTINSLSAEKISLDASSLSIEDAGRVSLTDVVVGEDSSFGISNSTLVFAEGEGSGITFEEGASLTAWDSVTFEVILNDVNNNDFNFNLLNGLENLTDETGMQFVNQLLAGEIEILVKGYTASGELVELNAGPVTFDQVDGTVSISGKASIPEPTTTTLSLLALSALAARRRRCSK